MELRQLRYFVAVAETENLQLAAERLHLAPSALSRRIHDLELSLGVALFVRERRGMRLSPAGQAFLPDAQEILKCVSISHARIHRFASGHMGTLRIGMQEITGRHRLIPETFRLFRRTYPNIDLKLTQMTTLEQEKALVARELDVGFFYVKEANPLFKSIEIDVDDWLLALPKGHALLKKTKLKLRDFREEPFVWIPRAMAPVLFDRLMAACERGGLAPRIVQEAKSEAMVLDLVAVGMGITFVTATASGYGPRDVVFRKVSDFSLPLSLNLVWRYDNESPVLALFVQAMRDVVKPGRKKPA